MGRGPAVRDPRRALAPWGSSDEAIAAMGVLLAACAVAMVGCGRRGAAVEGGLVKARDLPGNWTSHRHSTAGAAEQDARLGPCLGVERLKVAKRVSGNDFSRDSATD